METLTVREIKRLKSTMGMKNKKEMLESINNNIEEYLINIALSTRISMTKINENIGLVKDYANKYGFVPQIEEKTEATNEEIMIIKELIRKAKGLKITMGVEVLRTESILKDQDVQKLYNNDDIIGARLKSDCTYGKSCKSFIVTSIKTLWNEFNNVTGRKLSNNDIDGLCMNVMRTKRMIDSILATAKKAGVQ